MGHRTIQISNENYEILQREANAFEETTPNDVLTRILSSSGIKPKNPNVLDKIHIRSNKSKSKAGFRIWSTATTRMLNDFGSMSIKEIYDEYEKNWDKYFSRNMTDEEMIIVKDGPRGHVPAWKRSVFESIRNQVKKGQISLVNDRYSIAQSGDKNDTNSSTNIQRQDSMDGSRQLVLEYKRG